MIGPMLRFKTFYKIVLRFCRTWHHLCTCLEADSGEMRHPLPLPPACSSWVIFISVMWREKRNCHAAWISSSFNVFPGRSTSVAILYSSLGTLNFEDQVASILMRCCLWCNQISVPILMQSTLSALRKHCILKSPFVESDLYPMQCWWI